MPLPVAVVSNGNLKVLWVPTIAVITAPTVAELTAGSVVDLSCYLTEFTPATTENGVPSKRICTTSTVERRGTKQNTLQVSYTYNIETPSSDAARLALVESSLGHIVSRWATPYAPAIAAGDIVNIHTVEAGEQMQVFGAENEDLVITQKLFVYDIMQQFVTVAA